MLIWHEVLSLDLSLPFLPRIFYVYYVILTANAFCDPLNDVKCKLITSDGSEKSVTTDDQGKIEEEDLIPGEIQILPEKDEK